MVVSTDRGHHRIVLTKFSLYETKARYYIVGCDETESRFRVLKLDRTSPSHNTGYVFSHSTTMPNAAPVYNDKSNLPPGAQVLPAPVHMPLPVNAKAGSIHGAPRAAPQQMPNKQPDENIAQEPLTLANRPPISELMPIFGMRNMAHNGNEIPGVPPMPGKPIRAATMPAMIPQSGPVDPRQQRAHSVDEPPVVEDAAVYTRSECNDLLETIREGNRSIGGISKVLDFYGIIGFIRFTEGYYMVLITKRKPVATLGGHMIYQVKDTVMMNIRSSSKVEHKNHESRYIRIFESIDLKQDFYFSYAYDLTNTLQFNMTRHPLEPPRYNTMFMWNHYMLRSAFPDLTSDWVLPLVHGFVDQVSHDIHLTLIARRSRHFAGARFLKRGVNDQGYVANDVETEQIVNDTRFTSMHQPGNRPYCNPYYTSYVQHRGSIPLDWSQDTSNMKTKPPIHLNVVDPYYTATALHFNNMFMRYKTPIIVLNLVKRKEKTRRESILLDEFTQAINYLNQFLPKGKIEYIPWDMSYTFKKDGQNVMKKLAEFGEDALHKTNFFHSGPEPIANVLRRKELGVGAPLHGNGAPYRRQHGVVRTNCIDCIDRTNTAQFVIGKCALAHQLYALGVIERPTLELNSDIIDALTKLYDDHGHTLALQYGGSQLVNTISTYQNGSRLLSQSRDALEAIKRFYSNSFVDGDKQNAINLFLGAFVPYHGGPPLWELETDYHLHNRVPKVRRSPRSFTQWYTPALIEDRPDTPPPYEKDDTTVSHGDFTFVQPEELSADPLRRYWIETYPCFRLQSLEEKYTFHIKDVSDPSFSHRQPDDDPSPFVPHKSSTASSTGTYISGIKRWLKFSFTPQTPTESSKNKGDKEAKHQQTSDELNSSSDGVKRTNESNTMDAIVSRLLAPQVSAEEEREYGRYVEQFRSEFKSLKPIPHSGLIQDPSTIKHPEYRIYASYVNKVYVRPSELRVAFTDEQFYQAHVRLPKEWMETGFQNARNEPPVMRQRREAYARWLKTGKFRNRIPTAHNSTVHSVKSTKSATKRPSLKIATKLAMINPGNTQTPTTNI